MVHVFAPTFIILFVCHVVRSQRGTTLNFEEIFKGRCLDYRITRSGGLTVIPNIDCDALWSEFSSSWIFKEYSCAQNGTNFDNVFRFVNQTLPKNKSLFWSGTKDFAHKLSDAGRRYVTLEDSFAGFLVDSLTWCGQKSAPGIDYTSCPQYSSCPSEVVYSYWLAASKWFASQAHGEIYVLLNGSNSDPTYKAYRKNSIFASVEIVNLRSDAVTKLTAIVVHDLGKPIREKCGTNSLLDLKSDAEARNISFDCVENPPEVKYLLCTDAPNSLECIQQASVCENACGLIQSDGGLGRQLFALLTVATSLFVKYSST